MKKWWNCSLCILVQSPVTSSLQTLTSSSALCSPTTFHTHQTTSNITFLYTLIFLFFDSRQEDTNILDRVVADIPGALSAFNFSVSEIFVGRLFPNIWNVPHFFITYLYVVILSAFWSRDMTIYFIYSAFTTRPISSLATIKFLCFLALCMPSPNTLTSSAWTSSCCVVAFNFNPS